ncbi:putative epoxide hydrolase, partial [Pseudocercospora fuligena]
STSSIMADYSQIPKGATLKPTPFTAKASEEKLQLCKDLIRLSPIGPEAYSNTTTDRSDGMRRDWLTNAKKIWETDYDWRKTEARINAFPNYSVAIADEDGDNIDLHFIALFSKREDAVPISMSHGWPSCFFEFFPLLDVLTEKYSPEELPFHVIVPSLPGYAYSSVPTTKEYTVPKVAILFDQLMRGLGFNSYVAHGGDVGSGITFVQGTASDACKAIHVNNIFMAPPDDADKLPLDEVEAAARARADKTNPTCFSYASEHATRPGTIGLALQTSPVALLSWIGEKYLEWTDEDPPLEASKKYDNGYGHRAYDSAAHSRHCNALLADRDYGPLHLSVSISPTVTKPLGYSFFPYDISPTPRSWAEKSTKLTQYVRHERGGHFPGTEKPKELLADIEAFVKMLD